MRLDILVVALGAFFMDLPAVFGSTGVADLRFESTRVQSFRSPLGVTELCSALDPIPGGRYSGSNRRREEEFCSADFYSADVALCPKTWSTSPATMVLDLRESRFSTSEYENSTHCGRQVRGENVSVLAKFKQTMNQSDTSGTFSQSSLLYYHFSRYFRTEVGIPVAVYRNMDRQVHHERVAQKGLRLSTAAMIRAGWQHMVRAGLQPTSYRPTRDLFTDDQQKIYGVLVDDTGLRYGPEFNGSRHSGWGRGQNQDFQRTAGFLALRTNANIKDAIRSGRERALQDQRLRSHLVDVSDLQMAFWMREIIEITLLDYIFSQQDRIGNIDFRWYWYWQDGDRLRRRRERLDFAQNNRSLRRSITRERMARIPVPADLQSREPLLIQRTFINDNDAGGRVAYANFAKSTGKLEGLQHYSSELFLKLMELNQDLQQQGPVYQWLQSRIDLPPRKIQQIVTNTRMAADILAKQCHQLRFDLDDIESWWTHGQDQNPAQVDCSRY